MKKELWLIWKSPRTRKKCKNFGLAAFDIYNKLDV